MKYVIYIIKNFKFSQALLFFRIAGSTVIAIIRMQRLAKRWKEKIFDRIMSGGESHDSCCSSSSSRSVSVFSSASSRRSPVSEASSC